jgi:hydroxyquinol 1,2-dioxygenase
MSYQEKPASDFPEGMALSGKISGPFLTVTFDVTLKAE